MAATVAAARAGGLGCFRQGGEEDEEKDEEGRSLEKAEDRRDRRRGDPHLVSIVVRCWC